MTGSLRRLLLVSLLSICGCLTLPFAAYAQDIRTIALYKDSIPNSRPTPNEEQTEVTKEGVKVISKVSRPALTVYFPPGVNHTGAAVIICPGGGYWVEAVDLEGTEFAKRFAAAMAATHFSVPVLPGAQAADIRPDFLILGYPVITCFETDARNTGSCEQLIGNHPDSARAAAFSPEMQVSDATPPTFLVHASDDSGVSPENSILFYKALLGHHIPAELHLYERSGHG